ncbi:terminase small subunit [Pseudomonas sp. OV226]|uniref:terminase small subunit n=1 Tax=Pseudomonas sp. OV226 TaxID=2135588 RepID=UPI000D6B0549|nr:terminase small subunit [Pseudomonas sp. OV226]PWK31771.1 hypothetical protein C7534_12230 [Pseudomonas sp. OV226]
MTAPIYLSKKAFADRIGRSPSYVTQLKESSRLVLAPDGKKVDVLATEALILETADPSKAAVAARHQQDRAQRDGHGLPMSLTATFGQDEEPEFQKARALREHNLAQLAGIELSERRGLLVERTQVELAAYSAGRTLRDLLLGMSPQLAPELAAMTSHWEIEKRLTAELRRVLEDAERMSSADLAHVLTAES